MKIAKFEFSLFGINTYVVSDPATKKCAIIDPGMINEREEEAMKGYIEKNGLTVTHIINTHLHIDHAVGAKFASQLFNAPIYAHESDKILGDRMQEQAQMFGIGERIDNVSISTYLKDGDVIEIGEGRLKVVHVPGHSPGSIALYDEADGVLFSGDALFAESIGRTDLPGGNTQQLLDSINGKLMQLPDEVTVYPGHGPATTIGHERKFNPFLR